MNYDLYCGDCLDVLPTLAAQSVQCCVTSPPYFGLRDYGHDSQIGLESRPDQYVEKLVRVFREVWRVLADDGVLWLNLGDSYNGSGGAGGDYSPGGLKDGQPKYPGRKIDGLKPKDLIGIPWRVVFALQNDGWYLRSDVIWHKPNPMPESVTDRPTKAHEYLFLLTKQAQYYYDHEAIKEKSTSPRGSKGCASLNSGLREQDAIGKRTYVGFNDRYEPLEFRNIRSVWTISTQPYAGAHFAVMPPALVEPCILAGSRAGNAVLDPFAGSGTVGAVAIQHKRNFVGIELNADYIELAQRRIQDSDPYHRVVITDNQTYDDLPMFAGGV